MLALRPLLILVAFACISGASSAAAASFDCGRAVTSIEKAICASPALSQLDERAVAAYSDAVELLGIADDDDPQGDLLVRAHQEWLAARARCGAVANCLLQQYLRRLAVLSYKPDPQAAAALDALVGRYGTPVEPARELVIMAAPGGVVLVNVRVNATDWMCSFTGIGRSDGAGGLRVTRVEAKGVNQGAHVLALTPTKLGLAVRTAGPRDDVSTRFCGAGGSLAHPFPRRDVAR
jgi:uncharacterized protein